jgi:hypothetical protein
MSSYSAALKEMLLGQLNASLGGGKLRLYTGPAPATANDNATGTLVAELELGLPAGSVTTASGVTQLALAPTVASVALTPTTWSATDKGPGCTLSNGDLTSESNAFASVRSVAGVSSGKWFWEVLFSDIFGLAGIGLASADVDSGTGHAYPGAGLTSWAFYNYSAAYVAYTNDSGSPLAGVDSVGAGGTVGFALDMDAGTLDFVIGSVSFPAFSGIVGTVYAMAGGGSSGASTTFTANFGASPFTQAVPAGFTPGFGSASSSVPVALNSGTPGYGRLLTGANVSLADFTCGTDLLVSPVSAVVGDEVHINSVMFVI